MAQVGAVNIRLGATTNDFERAMQSAARALGRLSNASQGLQATNRTTESSFSGLSGTLLRTGAGFLTLEAALGGVKKALQIASDFQRVNTALRAVSTSSADYSRSQELLQTTANSLGISYQALAESYKGIKAAANGTALEGKGIERVFLSVVKAGAALQLSSDDTKGALLALQQMLSKGTVSAEELRGQLGERIPGAFGLMAKALGVNEVQLNKMLEQGQLLAADVLPKFAAELENTFGAQAQANVTTMAGGMQRLSDQTSLFISEFTQTAGIDTFFAKLTNGLADVTRGLREVVLSNGLSGLLRLAGGDSSGLIAAMAAAKAKDAIAQQNNAFKLASPEERKKLISVQEDIVKNSFRDYQSILARDSQTGVVSKALIDAAKGLNAEFKKRQELVSINAKLTLEEAKSAELLKKQQAEVNKLKASKVKAPKVQLQEISNEEIFKNALKNTLQLDPGNVNKIFNLQNLIRKEQGKSLLEVGVKLKIQELDTNNVNLRNQRTISALAPPKNTELQSATRDIILGTGFNSDIQKQQFTGFTAEVADQFGVSTDKATQIIASAMERMKGAVNLKDIAQELKLGWTGIIRDTDDFIKVTKDILRNAAPSAAQAVGDFVGGLIAGTASMQDFPKMILGMLADTLQSLAQALAAAGAALLLSPITAAQGIGQLAGSAGLFAASALARAGAQKKATPFASGGLVYGPTMGLVGEYPGARSNPEVIAPLSKLKDIVGTSSMAGGKLQIEVQGRIRGNDLDIIGARTKRANADKRGNR